MTFRGETLQLTVFALYVCIQLYQRQSYPFAYFPSPFGLYNDRVPDISLTEVSTYIGI